METESQHHFGKLSDVSDEFQSYKKSKNFGFQRIYTLEFRNSRGHLLFHTDSAWWAYK